MRSFKDRPDRTAIFIRCEPDFLEEVRAVAADSPFEGNVAQFSRDAIRTAARLRRALGPRYELMIAGLLADAEKREGVAA